MKNFMVILGLAVGGLGLAFMLVFSAGPYSSGAQRTNTSQPDIEFSTVPISFFRSFTTINGDFDVETLWLTGSPAVAVFMLALLFGNVVLLNLLIAIVSDEFDQFMERASLEAQLALAAMCKEAREVLTVCFHPTTLGICSSVPIRGVTLSHVQMGVDTHPSFFPRHLFVLQAKSEEVRDTDEWAGKVKAVVKRVDVLQAAQDEANRQIHSKIDTANGKINEANGKINEANSKIDALNKNMEKIMELLMKE